MCTRSYNSCFSKQQILTATLTNSGTVIQGINIRWKNTWQFSFKELKDNFQIKTVNVSRWQLCCVLRNTVSRYNACFKPGYWHFSIVIWNKINELQEVKKQTVNSGWMQASYVTKFLSQPTCSGTFASENWKILTSYSLPSGYMELGFGVLVVSLGYL
jgi:hypothetical protein